MARKRAPYTPCKLYVDGADGIEVGDFITTAAGSAYLGQTPRVSRTRPERKHMDCLRWPTDLVPEMTNVLQWMRRPARVVKQMDQGGI